MTVSHLRLIRDEASAPLERICRPFHLQGWQLVVKVHGHSLEVDDSCSISMDALTVGRALYQ